MLVIKIIITIDKIKINNINNIIKIKKLTVMVK